MTATTKTFLERWHRAVAERSARDLGPLLAPDIEMGAPPYWARLTGHDLVQHLLGIIVTTIEDFTYHREWSDGSELALEFTGHVAGLELQGVDLISLDDQGRVRSLDVVIRPLNAITALRDTVAPRMAEFLATR